MNVTNTNWNAIIDTAMQGSVIEGADKIQTTATQDADGNLAITLTDVDGRVLNFTAEAPELDAATGEPTPEALAALEARLDAEIENLQKKAEEIGQLAKSTGFAKTAQGNRKVLFDIYSLMNLMLEISKQQREAARTERQADLNRAVTDIENQAETQREAARLGMFLSIGLMCLNVGMQAYSMMSSAKAMRSAQKMEANAGLGQVSADLKVLTAPNAEATAHNLSHIEGKMSDPQKLAVRTSMEGTIQAKTDLETAQQTHKTAVDARQNFMKDNNLTEEQVAGFGDVEDLNVENLNDEMIADQRKTVDTLENDVQELEMDLEDRQSSVGNLDGESGLETELAQKKSELKQAKADLQKMQSARLAKLDGDLKKAEADLKTAQENLPIAADADLTRLDGELAKERITLEELESGKKIEGKDVATQKAKIKDLEAQRAWGRAFATDAKMQFGMKASIADDIKSCESIVGQKMDQLKLNAEYKKYNSRAEMYMAAGRVAEQVGQMLNGIVHGGTESISAGATDYQAEAKTHEYMQQESDDLAQSAQQLLRSILDMIRQVLEAENQSIRQIVA